jgi:NAD-dependent deacetylase
VSKKKIVVLTGAGISAESGLKTFRDSGGLWEGHRVEDVASPEGWMRDRELVLDFYNMRRRDLLSAQPNAAHIALTQLEAVYDLTIITQNVDDLHERAGSTQVFHLHGELLKVRSTLDETLVYDWRKDLVTGDTCERGAQLRPHIVWFGEEVPMLEPATRLCREADVVLIIGTSLAVYPAAGLIYHSRDEADKYLINPDKQTAPRIPNLKYIFENATVGVPHIVQHLLAQVQ